MALPAGANANVGLFSYVAVGREPTFKTYATATAGIEFLSFSMKTMKENKVIEQISTSRTYQDSIGLSKTIEGDMEFYMAADNDACQYILQNAMGGGVIATATATVGGTNDTTGAGVLEHTYSVNNFDATYTSLCLTTRKGDSTHGKTFGYCGVRVGELTLSGEVDEALKASVSLVGCDTTTTVVAPSASLYPNVVQTPLSFDGHRVTIDTTFGSITASAFWSVQSFEWGLSNNLASDSDSRRLGSDVLDVLPPGMATFTFNVSMRFDTLTAYTAMLNQTRLAGQISCIGATYSGSTVPRRLEIDMPYIIVSDAGDPEIGGPDEILKSDVTFTILRDPTSSGYAAKIRVTNKTTSYA